ncbi:MAG: hypothetical protein OEU26_00010 [Candidatus Tectomicrobia bacterium]|nr:hypothetical protein [Candidatus Tectomicrobia bacterium]
MESKNNPLALGAMIEGVHVSFYPEDIDTAGLLLQELLKRTENIGIGLMQVNYYFHVKGTEIDPVTLFDDRINRTMGCRILGHALAASGSLWEGIGRYHSRTPSRTGTYAIRVLREAMNRLVKE